MNSRQAQPTRDHLCPHESHGGREEEHCTGQRREDIERPGRIEEPFRDARLSRSCDRVGEDGVQGGADELDGGERRNGGGPFEGTGIRGLDTPTSIQLRR